MRCVRRVVPLALLLIVPTSCDFTKLVEDSDEEPKGEVVQKGPSDEAIIEYLINFARSPKTGSSDDLKAMALASSIDAESREVFTAEFEIEKEGSLIENNKELIVGHLSKGKGLVKDLDEREDDASAVIQIRLVDLLMRYLPNDADLAFQLYLAEKKSLAPNWHLIVKNPESLTGGAREEMSDSKEFGRAQSQVHGLLVQDMNTGRFAGKQSLMNATLSQTADESELTIKFNQDVGPMMNTALKEVQKFISVRHGDGHFGTIEIAFENQYSSKDGPSAAVVCALLVDSLISGEELSEEVALTGDMNADGLVKPIGGVFGKIRGAQKGGRKIVAIPEKNAPEILDMLIANGPTAITGIQIFSISSFEEAYALTRNPEKRDPNLSAAIEEFSKVQEVLLRPDGASFLKNPHVVSKLKEIVGKAPNHVSAKNLLLAASGRTPGKFSLRGSLTQIDIAAEPLISILKDGNFDPRTSPFADDENARSQSNLLRIRPMVDQRTLECIDALHEFAGLMRTYINKRPNAPSNLRSLVSDIGAAADRVESEYDKLESDVENREELNR